MINKLGFKIAVALSTFALGISFFWLFQFAFTFTEKQSPPANIEQPLLPNAEKSAATKPHIKIDIQIKQFVQTKDGLALEVEITNRSSKTAYYLSHSREPFDQIKFNNQEEAPFRCGTRLKEFYLLPGDSIIVRVHGNRFYQQLKEQGDFQIGYGFIIVKGKFEKFWSDKFRISEEIKQQILSETPDWFKKISESSRGILRD